MTTITCACGCGRTFELEPGHRGRSRKYASDACRKRAQRARDMNVRWMKAVEGELHVDAKPPRAQLANTIAEAAAIAASFRRLAIEETSPVLGAGCERSYREIIGSLDRNFPGWSR